MADVDYAVRVVWAVKDSLDQTIHALRQMRDPKSAFEEKQSTVNASIDQALRGHHSAQDRADREEAEKFRENILRHSAELHQLRQDYEATLDAKTRDFEQQHRLVIENLCRLLVKAVGPDLFQKALRDITTNPSDAKNGTSAPANQPTPPATEAESRVVSPIEHPVTSPPADSERPRKRRIDTEPESPRRRKRTVPTSKRISFMWFDEVYAKGHAETKHIIVEHPKGAGQWYIIRCQDCPRDFKDKPLVTAGSHLSSDVHGNQPRDAAKVVENFGIPVLDCNEVLAEKNNAVARQAFRKQEKGPRPPDDTAAKDSKHGRRGAAGIVNPTPGQIYLGYWGKAKKSWPVLLLPTTNLEDVGVPDTLEGLKLLKRLPQCYRYNSTTKTLEWKEGFENGGEKVAQRRFPVMFFDDGLKFPFESEVGWLSAHDLEVLDIESPAASDVPHIRSVRAYLKARPQIPSRQDEPSEMDVHDGQADAITRLDNETHHTPDVDESNSPKAAIVQPRGRGVKAGPVPIVNDGETSIEADGNSNGNLRRESIDTISISSTPVSESREMHPDEAAVPSHRELNRTTSAPNADVETTTSNNISPKSPDQPAQVDTAFEATVDRPHLDHRFSIEPSEVLKLRADYLATIAQNGLQQNSDLSDSVPPESAQHITPRENNTRQITPTSSEFSRPSSLGNPTSHVITIPPRVENARNPFKSQNQSYQYHGPNTPQVENRSNNSTIPLDQAQPQSQLNNRYGSCQPNLRPEMVQEQPTVPISDPRHTGQHVSWSRRVDQGTATGANHHGVSEHNRTWVVGNEASRSQEPYQGSSHPHPSENTWRSINGIR